MKIVDLTKNYLNSLVRELAIKIPSMPALTKNISVQRLAILVVVALLLSVLLTPQIDFSRPAFEIGSIATKDIKADKDFLFEDRASTEQKKREISELTKSVYDSTAVLLHI